MVLLRLNYAQVITSSKRLHRLQTSRPMPRHHAPSPAPSAALALGDPHPTALKQQQAQYHYPALVSRPNLRIYDAVGPETISIVDLLHKFARYQVRMMVAKQCNLDSVHCVHVGWPCIGMSLVATPQNPKPTPFKS